MSARRSAVRLSFVLASLLGAGVAVGVRTAWADAGLNDAIPRAGSVLEAPPNEIVLDFDGEIEESLSSVRLFDASGAEIAMDDPLSTPDHTQLVVPVHSPEDLGAGVYVVRYRVTTIDSRVERDVFAFQIGTGTADQQSVLARVGTNRRGSATLDWLLGAMRFVAFAALALILGSWSIAVLEPSPEDQTVSGRRLLTRIGSAAVAVSAVTAVLLFVAQAAKSAGKGIGGLVDVSAWSDLASARFGMTMLVRLGLVGLGALVVGGLGLAAQRAWRIAAAVLAGCLVLTFGLVGHPAVDRLPGVGMLLDALHVMAAAVWIGGVACLVVGRRVWLPPDAGAGSSGSVAARFLRVVPVTLCVMAVTGGLQTWRVVHRADAFGNSTYGHVFIGKMALVAILVIVAIIGSSVLRRFDVSSVGRLLVAQGVLGLAVLGASAGLVALDPEASIRLQPATVSVSQGSLTAIVTVTPARVGSDDVHVIIGQTDAVKPTSDVRLSISKPDHGIADVVVPLAPDGPDHYSAFGVNIPYAGVWQVVLEVGTGIGATVSLTTSVTIAS